MPNSETFLDTEPDIKHIRRRAICQQHGDTNCHQVFFQQGEMPKEIQAILIETLGEYVPSYATIKKWVAQLKSGDFSTCDAPRPGRTKIVTTPEFIETIQELILEDRRISSKSIAEQLVISRERLGPIIHEDLDIRKLSTRWVPKCMNADQNRQRCQSSEQYLEFFRRDPKISCCDW